MPELAAILITIGIIIATVPVLLTKAPINEVANTTKMKALVSLPLADRKSVV